MGVFSGPEIKEDGLVLALDAGNVKSNSEISFNKWNNVIADATTVSSVGVITCLSIDTASSNFFGIKWTTCGGTTNEFDNRPPSIANMNTILETFLDCKSYQTGTYNSAGAYFGGFGGVGNMCTLRFTGFGVGALIGIGAYFNTASRKCRLTGDLVNSPLTITSPTGGFADPIVLTSDPADIQFENPGSNGDPMYVYWLGPYNQVPYVVRDNPGYIINGATYSSDDGGALVFDGTDDYVNAPVTKTASCTFSCWAKSTDVNGRMLFNAGPSGSGPDLFFYDNTISWNTWDGNSNSFGSIPASVTDGNWHYYVVVNDASSNAKLYYDGELLGTATYRNASANTNLTIGGNTDTYQWNGSISNFQLHNKVLTVAEIQKNYNALKGRYGL